MATYEFWMKALHDPSQIGVSLKVHESDPQPGFYRMRARDEGADMIPVAIWVQGGELIVKAGDARAKEPEAVWTFCCRHPVSEEDYHDAMSGKGWKDTPPASPTIGHNMPDDPYEQIKLEFQGEAEIADELLSKPVKSEEDADKVANFAKRIALLGKKADELFSIEKRPLLDASRAVDDKWRDLREGAKSISTKLKRHIETFLAEQRRLEQERQRKAAEEAEAIRRKAEEAARKAENIQSNPNDPEQEAAALEAKRLQEEAAKAEREAKAKPVAVGRTGSKVSMRTFKSGKIVDYDKLVEALKDRDEMKELVQSLANRAARSDIELPGMEIITEERAV